MDPTLSKAAVEDALKTRLCQEWLERLSITAEDEDDYFTADRAEDLPYLTWGFTIYRTSYAPSSEPQWKHLIQKIQSES